ncbi:hypothetical protein HDR66_03430 [bacterium]|nr:hypothetical protein [bacterium]
MAQDLNANRVVAQKADTLKHLAAEYDRAVARLEQVMKESPNDERRIAIAREKVANLEKYKAKGK